MLLADLIYLTFYGVMIYSAMLWLFVYFSHRNKLHDPEPLEEGNITILVPAYNEEKNIANCIEHLKDLDYPKSKLKIILIDDGSIDRTREIMLRYKGENITVISKSNSGKADSLNVALDKVNTEWVACMDGDSYPKRDYLKKMVGYLKDENVVAVTPALKISRPKTWIQKLQWSEYIFQIFLRKMFAIFNIQYVIPGPGSVYRTKFLKETGGFDKESITEDMEVGFRTYKYKYRLENSKNAEVYTEAPETLRGVYKQRIRWYKGYLQTFKKYRHFFLNPKYGNLGLYLLPVNFIWLTMLIFFLVYPIYVNVVNLVDYVHFLGLVGFEWPSFKFEMSIMNLSFHTIFLLFFVVLTIVTMYISLKVSNEKVQLRKRFLHYLLYFTLYIPLLTVFWISALIKEIIGEKKGW